MSTTLSTYYNICLLRDTEIVGGYRPKKREAYINIILCNEKNDLSFSSDRLARYHYISAGVKRARFDGRLTNLYLSRFSRDCFPASDPFVRTRRV